MNIHHIPCPERALSKIANNKKHAENILANQAKKANQATQMLQMNPKLKNHMASAQRGSSLITSKQSAVKGMDGMQSDFNVYQGIGRTSNHSFIPLGGRNGMHTSSVDNIVDIAGVTKSNDHFVRGPFDNRNNSMAEFAPPDGIQETMITLQPVQSDEEIAPRFKQSPNGKVTFKTLELNKDLNTSNDGHVIADQDELDSVQHFDMSIIDDVDAY